MRIPRLEDLTLLQRIIATIVIIVVVILVLSIAGMFTVEGQSIRDIKVPERFEERLLKLDRDAIEEAYKRHIIRLFDVWTTDYSPGGHQPPRAVKGANNARGVYIETMIAIERREQELKAR